MRDPRLYWALVLTVLVILMFLYVLPANSAPKPNYAARLTANYHLQIEVSSVTVPDVLPGECWITGTIVRLFRSRSGTLETGDKIDVPVFCTTAQDDVLEEEITAVSELQNARFVEMYLNPLPEAGFELAHQQFMVIKSPSDQPQCETERAGIMC